MRRIILHIGYPKTGTSSIEAFLRDNREALDGLGFHVPGIGQGRHGAHHALASVLAGLPLPPNQAVSESEIIARLSEATAQTILISSEKLTGVLAHPKSAERLLTSLRATGAALTLVMYVRNQTQMLNSGYCQRVKSFRHRGDFRAYATAIVASRASFQYAEWAERAERYGLELRARPFSEQVRRDGVIHDFLATIGCPRSESLSLPPRVNVSAGPFTVEAARRLQHWAAEKFQPLTMRQATRCKTALEQAIGGLGIEESRYCGLDSNMARRAEAVFADSNDRFARRMWGSDWRDVFQSDVGQRFESNDYQDTGVPPAMREPLREVVVRMRSEMRTILQQPRLAVREEWNRLHA